MLVLNHTCFLFHTFLNLCKSEIAKALVGIIMGSESDWETMKNAATTLQNLNVSYEVKIVSAHRFYSMFIY